MQTVYSCIYIVYIFKKHKKNCDVLPSGGLYSMGLNLSLSSPTSEQVY